MPVKFWMGVFLAAALCGTATSVRAQVQNDPSGHIGPSTAEIVGILVGTGAAIGVVVYLVIPRQKTIEGCVEASDGCS
jgi:cytosine/uracil/thiamine/allantoin permease